MKPKALLFLVCFLAAMGLLTSPAQAVSVSLDPHVSAESAIGLFAGLAIVGLLAFAFWIWMLVDCLTSKRLDSNDRLLWVLLIVFLGVLGGLSCISSLRRISEAPGAPRDHKRRKVRGVRHEKGFN